MGVERAVVLSFAKQINSNLVKSVVIDLQSITEFMQSGENSGLENIWEEMCVQLQGFELADFSGYQCYVDGILEDIVPALAVHERFALWLATDAGRKWSNERLGDDETAPLDEQDIIDKLSSLVMSAASDFENERICKYLWRLEAGGDDVNGTRRIKTVIWSPEGANETLLTAVRISPGKVTEDQWMEALSDRVTAMVMSEEDPQEAFHQAVKELNQAGAVMLPEGNPRYSGQTLVTHNLELVLKMSLLNPEFPMIAKNNVSEPELMDDLDNWVELASMALHPS